VARAHVLRRRRSDHHRGPQSQDRCGHQRLIESVERTWDGLRAGAVLFTAGAHPRAIAIGAKKPRSRGASCSALPGLSRSARTLGSLFGSFGKTLIVLGDSQHRFLRLRLIHLLRDAARLACALSPVFGVIDEGRRHVGTSGGGLVYARLLKLRARPH